MSPKVVQWGGEEERGKTQKEGNSPVFFLLPSFQHLPSAKSPKAIVKTAGTAGVWERGQGALIWKPKAGR